jgi:hypothetical protein
LKCPPEKWGDDYVTSEGGRIKAAQIRAAGGIGGFHIPNMKGKKRALRRDCLQADRLLRMNHSICPLCSVPLAYRAVEYSEVKQKPDW